MNLCGILKSEQHLKSQHESVLCFGKFSRFTEELNKDTRGADDSGCCRQIQRAGRGVGEAAGGREVA